MQTKFLIQKLLKRMDGDPVKRAEAARLVGVFSVRVREMIATKPDGRKLCRWMEEERVALYAALCEVHSPLDLGGSNDPRG